MAATAAMMPVLADMFSFDRGSAPDTRQPLFSENLHFHGALVQPARTSKLRTMIGESEGSGESHGTIAGSEAGFRSGFVAVIGLPNVGKSTLVNRLVGQKLSIVTAKAQTTRQRMLAIYTDNGHQAVFVDTPGLLEPRYLLQQGMREEADSAAVDADLILYVVDAGYPRSLEHASEWQGPPHVPAVLCLNKTDRIDPADQAIIQAGFQKAGTWRSVFDTVATLGEGVDELRSGVLSELPEGPQLYPEDEVATAPLRFFAAELIRETCFEELGQELPYSIAVGIEEFRESEVPIYVGATVFVERDSQKGMVIGKGGTMVRRIGTSARRKLETMVETRVYLDLRVKVLRNWRRNPARLKLLGYPVPSRKE